MTDVAGGPTGGTRLAIEYKKEKETSLADSYGNPSSIASALSAHPRVLSGEGSTIQSPPPLFFSPSGKSARAHQFHSLGQVQSSVAQRAETTVCGRVFADELRVSSFP